MLRSASNGNRNSLEKMGLEEGFHYDIPLRFDPEVTSSQELEEEIDDLMFFTEAANCLHMDKSETVACKFGISIKRLALKRTALSFEQMVLPFEQIVIYS